MGIYFFDLRDDCFAVQDQKGEECVDQHAAGERASLILSQIAGDMPLIDGRKSGCVTVRDEANRIVFTATLNIVGQWTDVAAEVVPSKSSSNSADWFERTLA